HPREIGDSGAGFSKPIKAPNHITEVGCRFWPEVLPARGKAFPGWPKCSSVEALEREHTLRRQRREQKGEGDCPLVHSPVRRRQVDVFVIEIEYRHPCLPRISSTHVRMPAVLECDVEQSANK